LAGFEILVTFVTEKPGTWWQYKPIEIILHLEGIEINDNNYKQ